MAPAAPEVIVMFQSAPGSMSRENITKGNEIEALNKFQSAPGSMSRENGAADAGVTAGGRVSIRSRLDEPGERRLRKYLYRFCNVSIRSRLDEPGERWAIVVDSACTSVSIRSRLDEPGEPEEESSVLIKLTFQSAPGSMSRENAATLEDPPPVAQVSIRSRLDEPGELNLPGSAWIGTCFNPLPAR